MTRIRIKQLLVSGEEGQSITICGWVKSKRVSKNFAFLVLNDGSCQSDIQCIIDADKPFYDSLGLANTGASVRLDGVLKASPGKGQAWEVQVDRLEVLGEAAEGYPLQKKGHTMEFLREIAHLRGRSNTFGAVYRVRNQLAMMVHEFFQSKGFQWAHTPTVTEVTLGEGHDGYRWSVGTY